MHVMELVILAIVQGIAEFLPISSSGHLVLVGWLLGETSESATVEIILHTGTLASILVVYWKRIFALLRSDRRAIPLLVIGTVPAVLVGFPLKMYAESVLKNPVLAGSMLLVTGSLLLGIKYLRNGDTKYADLTWWQAFLIGCFQAFAILPGVSRSGSTIFGGRMLGLRAPDALTFSFLLAIPAISGASVLAIKDLMEEGAGGTDVALLITGAVISFTTGVFALRWLIRWSTKDRLHWFAFWCIPVGLLSIALYMGGYLEAGSATHQ
ncbi:MAG TPA: undecaprenyl-diphosphate phosphatase [Planctomycetaceae bacterium]|nr:undecaprenyl-diphosphate phosphatase [Planctomycetaceae bacterium]